MSQNALKIVKNYYLHSSSIITKIHLLVKFRKNNAMIKLEKYIPKEGKILDVGCGHGIFSNLLIETSYKREVVGIDIDKVKIQIAQGTVKGRKAIHFDILDIDEVKEKFDVIVIYDVLHHIKRILHLRFLQQCYCKLNDKGLLVIKDVNKKYFIRYFIFCYLVDTINAIINITKGGERAFLNKTELTDVVSKANFTDICIEELNNKDITPHLILTARKIL